jgi:hypothetical protein
MRTKIHDRGFAEPLATVPSGIFFACSACSELMLPRFAIVSITSFLRASALSGCACGENLFGLRIRPISSADSGMDNCKEDFAR